MAKGKHQKPSHGKQTKQPRGRKHGDGRQKEISDLRAQLDLLGLKIIQVTADGNCFFRALADQLEGNEDEHEKYRTMVVRFIKGNREMFEPFVEDESFDDYCHSMGEDGTWAGNIELQAASLVTHCNICIHRYMSPRWYIQNFEKQRAKMIHLVYLDGEHYNSVRIKEDTCSGPARAIIIKGEADLSVKSNERREASVKSKEEGGNDSALEESINLVKVGSGCEDTRKIKQVLHQMGGDVEAAAEVLAAVKGSLDQIAAEDKLSPSMRSPYDECQVENSEGARLRADSNTCEVDSSGSVTEITYDKKISPPDEKQKIPRNKNCPCGSKKKYKSCCGTVTAKASARFPVNQTIDYGKSRKDRKQCRRGGATVTISGKSEAGPLDMGALCI